MIFTTFELFYVTLVAGFIGLVVLGHALLISAIYKCLRDDRAFGRRSSRKPPLSDWPSRVVAKVTPENENSGDVPSFGPINLKTAKTLGLVVPPTLLARADEVIE